MPNDFHRLRCLQPLFLSWPVELDFARPEERGKAHATAPSPQRRPARLHHQSAGTDEPRSSTIARGLARTRQASHPGAPSPGRRSARSSDLPEKRRTSSAGTVWDGPARTAPAGDSIRMRTPRRRRRSGHSPVARRETLTAGRRSRVSARRDRNARCNERGVQRVDASAMEDGTVSFALDCPIISRCCPGAGLLPSGRRSSGREVQCTEGRDIRASAEPPHVHPLRGLTLPHDGGE